MSMHGTGHYEDAADDAAPLLMPAELYRRHSVRQLQLQVAGGKIKLKRPPEPIVPLDDAAIRIAELKALVAQGRAEADADNVRAGFFGGDGKTSLLLWGGAFY
eukprot:gene9114-23922_t